MIRDYTKLDFVVGEPPLRRRDDARNFGLRLDYRGGRDRLILPAKTPSGLAMNERP